MLTTKQMSEPGTMMVAPVPLPGGPPTVNQAGKGMARRIGRYLAEPAFIAGCALAGALFAAQDGHPHADAPVIGMAVAAAGIATGVGMARLFVREGYRGGWKMIGGIAVRLAFFLLFLGFEAYGLSCWCDGITADLPQLIPRHGITFKEAGGGTHP